MKHSPLKLIFAFALLLLTVTFQFTGCSSDKDEPSGPHIDKLTPDTGSIGTEVVITGKGLIVAGESAVVKFNGVEARVKSIDNDAPSITVIAPNGGTTGPVTVTSGAQRLTGPVFTYAGDPVSTSEYFVKFKVNGAWIMFETGEPGYSTCGQCACSSVPPAIFEDIDNAFMEVCNEGNHDYITGPQIVALKNKTLSFSTGYPRPQFSYDFNDVSFGTDGATQTADSKMVITNVTFEGNYYAGQIPVYKVEGTFSCKVVKGSAKETIDITEGSFAVRFMEDY